MNALMIMMMMIVVMMMTSISYQSGERARVHFVDGRGRGHKV